MQRLSRFITLEGIDGCGKTTQKTLLCERLKCAGVEVVETREPGGTELAEKIRSLILSNEMDPAAETLLFFAARAEHVERRIKPALQAGRWVVSDRFADATYAYQTGAKGFSKERTEAIENAALMGFEPDLTILLDIAPKAAAQRRIERLKARGESELVDDRFEKESEEFFCAVRGAYLERARMHPERFFIVDAQRSSDAIADEIWKRVEPWL